MQNKKVIRKPGRTLVVTSEQSISTEEMTGLQNSVKTTSGSQFFIFDNVDNSKAAFKLIKDRKSVV